MPRAAETARTPSLVLLALASLPGCHEGLVLEAPDTTGARGIVLVEVGEAQARVHALNVTPEGTDWPALAPRGEVELYAELFSCPVERLGLEPGQVPEAAPSGARLPPPVRAVRRPSLDAAWTEVSSPSEAAQTALRGLPIDASTACERRRAQLERVQVSLPVDGHGEPAFAITLGDGTALIGSREGFYYRVDGQGGVQSLSRLVAPEPRGAHATADGTIYLLDAEGTLHSGRVDGAFEVLHRDPALGLADQGAAMAGPPDASAARELFLSTTRSTFHHFDGTRWTTTATAPSHGLTPPQVLWRGPGRAASVGYGPIGFGVAFFESGRLRVFVPPRGRAVGLTEHGGGLVVGTREGEVYRFDGVNWTELPIVGFDAFAHLLLPLPRGGLLVGGITSISRFEFGFAQLFDDLGLCAAEQLSALAAGMARVDEHTWVVVTVSSLISRQAFDIGLIRQTAPPAACSGP